MIKIVLSILMYLLLTALAYWVDSKLVRKEVKHPVQFGIMWIFILIALGLLGRYILTHI